MVTAFGTDIVGMLEEGDEVGGTALLAAYKQFRHGDLLN
jgi:hypothetical protein